MKHLPWILLALVLAYPLFAQGSLNRRATGNGPVKILGQPAASEWVDIESNDANGSPTQYIVPVGRVLTLERILRRPDVNDGGGLVVADIQVDGVQVLAGPSSGLRSLTLGEVFAIPSTDSRDFGETAREGQVVLVARTGGSADAAQKFILRGWLEDIR